MRPPLPAASLACLCAASLLAPRAAWGGPAEGWKTYSEEKGARFERRDVAGSSYPELRATKEIPQAPAQVLEAIWRSITDGSRPPLGAPPPV